MKRNLTVWLLCWCLSRAVSYAQSAPPTQPVVSNVRVEASAEQVVIRYDVAGLSPKDSVYLQVEGRTRGLFNVRTLAGDAGTAVTAGLNKTVVWSYKRDGELLEDEIQARVNVKRYLPTTAPTNSGTNPTDGAGKLVGGGPKNALLSAALPGLGNVMVQPGHRIRFQPVIAATYIGALVYGFSQKSKSDDEYARYLVQPYDRLATPYYNDANRYHHQYILAVSTAALIWVADVTYTFIKGRKNERQRTAQLSGLQPMVNYVGHTPTVGLRRQF